MRKLASIKIIDNIIPIEGANKIELVHIGGWKVVVAKDVGHQVGDRVVYCEINSFLPIEPEFEFLRKSSYKKMVDGTEGFRLKTIRLRGQISQGLIIPLEDAITMIKRNQGEVYYEMIEEDKYLTNLLGVTKYEPPISANLAGKVKGNFPSFISKTDEERCLSGETLIKTNDGEKTISEIVSTKYSGKVLSYNPITGQSEYNRIISHSTAKNKNKVQWFEIEVEDGTKIKVTGNHKIWLPNLMCYRRVDKLTTDDFILKSDL